MNDEEEMHRIICLKLCRFALECICKQRELLISQAIVSQFTKAKSFVRKKRRRIHPTNFTKKRLLSHVVTIYSFLLWGVSKNGGSLGKKRRKKESPHLFPFFIKRKVSLAPPPCLRKGSVLISH